MTDSVGKVLAAVWRGLAANTGLGMPVLGPLLASRDRLVAVALAERTDLTADAVSTLAAHPDGLVRKTLAGNPVAALAAWSRLVDDEDIGVRSALAKGHSTDFRPKVNLPLPEQAQTRLAADPEVEVRRALAHRRDLTAPAALRLSADVSHTVREAVAFCPSLPDVAVLSLLRDGVPQVRRNALVWSTPPPDLQAGLLADPETRPEAARCVRLDHEGIRALIDDDDPGVRQNVAGNPNVPYQWLLPLADDPDEDVRTELMLRPDLPDEVRARVVATVPPSPNPVALWLLPERASLDRRLSHVTSPFAFCRRAVAFSPDLPGWAVARLAEDEDRSVRLLLAEHHVAAPGHLLAELIPDVGHAVWELVQHPNMPAKALTELAVSGDDHLRAVAATGPNLPAEVAVTLASHANLGTRRNVAANPALPLPTVIQLLADPYVAEAAARNPRIPEELARRLITENAVTE